MISVSNSSKDTEKNIDEKIFGITSNVEIIPEQYDDVEYTPEEEQEVVKKIDKIVLPLLCFVFFSQYLDKQSLSYAAVFGLKKDLKLTGNEYSWLTSGFYLSQLASQFVYIYLLSRFPIKLVTGISIIIWAGVCMCLAAPNSFSGMVVVRCFLGFFEGCVSPAFVMVTSNYYKKSEHSLRTSIWISMNAIAQILCSFLIYGLGKNPHLKLATWKVAFLVCGSVTIVAGSLFLGFVPFALKDAWFLNDRQKSIAVKRILVEADLGEKDNWNWNQARECIFDWGTWFSFLGGILVTITSGPIIFSSLIINDMGYNSFKTIEYGSPSGAVQFLFIWVGAAALYFFPKQRCIVICLLTLVPIVGNIMLLVMRERGGWAVIVGSWLGACITSFYAILLSLNASNIRGNTKKSIVNNMFYIGYCVGCVIYAQWWNYSKDPTYKVGLCVDIAAWGFFICMVMIYRFKCIYENKKRDKLLESGKIPEYSESDDLTDVQDLRHRYSY
ncbi:hypothetical protein C6P40_003573 [Pichia californica]|uniref:Allantoate permease n=1 Tax=Pichia californica TaxID=460514 RepID=A0A9P6WGT8_9ASCO|nr:hypothetical protein C6P42_003300 [[Candida] californica]KAG0686682.1 hypothetical protein C6P40_003573 [[Candida] californica]